MSEFLSQTDLGKLFGVSSHVIGKWLLDCGLRTENKKPSRKAFEGGYVEKAACKDAASLSLRTKWSSCRTNYKLFDCATQRPRRCSTP